MPCWLASWPGGLGSGGRRAHSGTQLFSHENLSCCNEITCALPTPCRHGGSAAQQLLDAGAVDAVLHALGVALCRAQPAVPPFAPAYSNLRGASFVALVALVIASQAKPRLGDQPCMHTCLCNV